MLYSSQRPQVCIFVKKKAKRNIWWSCLKSHSIPNLCFIGNFIYFYTKKDYTIFRLLKMLFRLNFLVFCVMAVTSHMFVRYYICAMHTYWFLSVWAVMVAFNRYNDVSVLCWWFGENIFIKTTHRKCFVKKRVLKNFENFTRKQAFRPAPLLKRDSNTGLFLWNVWNL